MFRNVVEYKTCGDLLGAIKQALRRFTPIGICLIKFEQISFKNQISGENLLITDGNSAIRITEITSEDLDKLKTLFNEIAVPYIFQDNKWVSVLKDPYYDEGVIKQVEDLFNKEN